MYCSVVAESSLNLWRSEMTKKENAEFREIFNLVDRNGSGLISKDELTELMHSLGIEATQDEVSAMIKEIDEDLNDEIDFEEFSKVMSRKINSQFTQEQVCCCKMY